MAKRGDILSPHQIGEPLLEALFDELGMAKLEKLPVFDPKDGFERQLATVLPTGEGPLERFAPLVRLDPSEGRLFDGMHDLDFAFEFKGSLVACELKLGETRLEPPAFAKRFVSDTETKKNQPRINKGKIAGSMVALLDWNGRSPSKDSSQPFIRLQVGGKPVRGPWLLVVLENVLKEWKGHSKLLEKLQLVQLAGILTLESVARAAGPGRAKEIAKRLTAGAIDGWNL
jgi:hypothetical protein